MRPSIEAPLPSQVPGLEPALSVMADALRRSLRPPKRRRVWEWAAAERRVSEESGSPHPGRWSNDLAPYLVEIMDCLSLSHPSRSVAVRKGAQLGVTECGLNLQGQIIDESPCSILTVLPSISTLNSYVKEKLGPTLDATPALKSKVKEQKSRDEDGSTTTLKKFPGGVLSLTTASSSKGLQMISRRVVIFEEVSEYPYDVDGRGDPVAMGETRTSAWAGREKVFYNSTPAIKGACRITVKEEAGDQRRLYVPCPHCGDFQQLLWARMEKEGKDAATYGCASCGELIQHHYKRGMLRQCVWLKCFPGPGCPPAVVAPEEIESYRARSSEGRQPSFAFSKLYSPFVSWMDIVAKWKDAKGVQRLEKEFCQQDLGEAYEETGEAPDHERLFERRLKDLQPGRVPVGALFLTGAADVQSNRLEWAVWAWGVGFARWLVDHGVIEGDPHGPEVWRKLDAITQRRYEDWRGEFWSVDAFGCDSGYATTKVYSWALRHAGTGRIFALDGRPGWKLPPLGTPKKIDVDHEGRKLGAVLLWPVGTWDLKSELYRSLRNLILGQDPETGEWPIGTCFFGENVDRGWIEQLTCEYLADDISKSGYQVRVWKKPQGKANEAHDIAVYAAALAHHLADRLSAEDWARLAAQRNAPVEKVQGDLAQLWGANLAPTAGVPPPDPALTSPAANDVRALESGDDWLGAGDWLRGTGRDWLN